jgi:hypothetical protein
MISDFVSTLGVVIIILYKMFTVLRCFVTLLRTFRYEGTTKSQAIGMKGTYPLVVSSCVTTVTQPINCIQKNLVDIVIYSAYKNVEPNFIFNSFTAF